MKGDAFSHDHEHDAHDSKRDLDKHDSDDIIMTVMILQVKVLTMLVISFDDIGTRESAMKQQQQQQQ